MEHEDRRKEAGKMFMDVAKYIVTGGVVGNLLSEKISPAIAASIFVVAVVSFLIGFYTIPPKRG